MQLFGPSSLWLYVWLLPLLFQLRFGWSAVAAGAMVTALFVGNVAIKPLTTPLMRRWGKRSWG